MSASREKKTRQDVTTQGPTEQEQKKQREAKEAHRSNILYATVGIVCVVLVAFLLVWQSGMIQRSAAAVTANGVEYTAADVQYYYNSILNQYGLRPGSISGAMRDTLMTSAADSLVSDAAIAAKAEAEGYTMSDEAKELLDGQVALLDTIWKDAGYKSQEAFLQANYGPYMTYDKLVALLNRQLLASDYSSSYVDSLEYTEQDLNGYYTENASALDSFTLTEFVLNAKVETTDDEGKTIEMTDEEKAAALEEAKAQKKAVAEEIQSKLEAGEDPAALAEAYADELAGGAGISQPVVGIDMTSAYAEWAKDDARKAGDVTLSEKDAGAASYYYYVVRFESRERNDAPTDTVRHILVAAETDEGASKPTEEQYAAAKEKAEALLEQWKADGATEDAFAKLAQENSADAGSAEEGGLISDIHAGSGYVPTFSDWATDDARKAGDTGIVQNTGSSVKGWHIMYYVGANGAPVWEQTANNALRSKDYTAWRDAAQEGYDATTGLGMKFVQA